MMEKYVDCVVCPRGCRIRVCADGGRMSSVSGNGCRRGEIYAWNELVAPKRLLSSTVKIEGAEAPLLPVRSSAPLPKNLIGGCIGELKKISVRAPVKIHDVIIADVLGSGVDVIASCGAESDKQGKD